MHNLHEIKKLRKNLIASAQQNVNKYISENRADLPQFIEVTIEKIDARDISGVKITAYQLFSAAKSFNRLDITNIAEMLYKIMNRPTYANDVNVLEVFGMVLRTLANSTMVDKNLENLVTKKIYEVLRNVPK